MKTYKIACIPGDGIGKEVIPAGQEVLQALAASGAGFQFEFTSFGWGGDWYRAHGKMMPDDGLDALRGQDAILFGSAGDPHIPDHITLWGLRLKICRASTSTPTCGPRASSPASTRRSSAALPRIWTG
jgi:tartrate dehydrogenase/decarboxylase/D-malate dehydrogenase